MVLYANQDCIRNANKADLDRYLKSVLPLARF